MNINQALVVLGEYSLKNRLLEDQVETLTADLTLAVETNKELNESIEILRSEKATLLLDVSDLEAKIEKKKGGAKKS